ncbi:MAG TPA: AbrB/MazE/SpoVT family DNA-binding domain-containing protein [Candidatus Nanoarchaeia archaeon]|nr:AbrB/MazE/SpoVT family DNA-binding domain-containing protein [Candidatus Nanoarchaeia archaeon]
MIETIKVSSKGQIVIPERIREQLEIEEGTKLVLINDGGRLFLEKEQEFLQKIKENEERRAWIAIGEESFAKIWDNQKDEETWKKYL